MLICCMKTVKEATDIFKQTLSEIYDPAETEAITLLTLSEISGFSKAKLKAFPETELIETQQQRLQQLLAELKSGKPVQYALGYEYFYGLKFEVNPAVLIPRPETEELVSWVIDGVQQRPVRILDIGTGSGCIAISLKHELYEAEVTAIDISTDALETARENAEINNADVNFVQADILQHQHLDLGKFDAIVSNPPYVTMSDKEQMHGNVTDFEPHTALFVPEDDPLIFYKAIADFALKSLNPNGLLFFEINESLGKETIKLLIDRGFQNAELRQDIRGKDRMVKAYLIQL